MRFVHKCLKPKSEISNTPKKREPENRTKCRVPFVVQRHFIDNAICRERWGTGKIFWGWGDFWRFFNNSFFLAAALNDSGFNSARWQELEQEEETVIARFKEAKLRKFSFFLSLSLLSLPPDSLLALHYAPTSSFSHLATYPSLSHSLPLPPSLSLSLPPSLSLLVLGFVSPSWDVSDQPTPIFASLSDGGGTFQLIF